MAWWDPDALGPDKSELLNSPRGSGFWSFLTTERCVGNNVGVYYVPEPAALGLLLLGGLALLCQRRK